MLYDELRELARRSLRDQPSGNTLQPTALVHATYMRLFGRRDVDWASRQHFFAVAAKAMRQIVVDHARRRAAAKRSGRRLRLSLQRVGVAIQNLSPYEIMVLDEALDRLRQLDARKAEVVNLRCFTGLSVKEAGAVLGVSAATIKRDWQFSKAWLYQEMVGKD